MTASSSSPTPRLHGASIGLKIFGIATSLLGLLVLVVYVSTNRLRQVSLEITALAEYVIPITDRVAQVDVHALEQELHFERVQKLYEIEPLDRDRIQAEIAAFEERNDQVDAEIAAAIALAKEALATAELPQNRTEWHHRADVGNHRDRAPRTARPRSRTVRLARCWR